MDVFTVIPVICFGYQCHVNAVPIYACLRKRTLGEFSKSIIVSIIIVFLAYTVSATFGYLTFGVNVDDDLLKSYDSKEASVIIAIVMYLIKTYTSYPLNLFCARFAIKYAIIFYFLNDLTLFIIMKNCHWEFVDWIFRLRKTCRWEKRIQTKIYHRYGVVCSVSDCGYFYSEHKRCYTLLGRVGRNVHVHISR